MRLFHRGPKVNPELEAEKAKAASRADRTDKVVKSLRELQQRNQFREQFAMTVATGGKH